MKGLGRHESDSLPQGTCPECKGHTQSARDIPRVTQSNNAQKDNVQRDNVK